MRGMARAGGLVLGLALAGPAAAQGVAAQGGAAREARYADGRQVAETWCANCHVIGPGARGPAGDAAPPFEEVANRASTTEMSLRAFLRTPHARMPNYELSQREMDGVVAYLLALRGG